MRRGLILRYSLVSGVSLFIGVILTLFILTPDSLHSTQKYKLQEKKIELIILILTAPSNLELRTAIRKTWLRGKTSNTVHLFVTGTKELSKRLEDLIDEENKEFNDMLLFDFKDSYSKLTDKVLLTFDWLSKHYSFSYMLKCDDDTFVKLNEFYKALHLQPSSKLYWGFFDGRSRVKKTGKWKELSWNICDLYLPYAVGGGYVLSEDLVEYISNNKDTLRKFKSEDISVGLWLAPLDVNRVHDVRFDTEWASRGCSNEYLITHKQNALHMYHKDKLLDDIGMMCEEETQKRISYQYNWNVPPSQCCIRNDTTLP